jgi:glycosyltransferase involved in cell wall biosynthesis
MPRQAGFNDALAARHTGARIAATKADVIHGHGAKGGAYARLAGAAPATVRAYTPHGGSLHYDRSTLPGLFYLTLERALMRRGDLFLFESAYSADVFRAKIGQPEGLTRVVHNGVGPADFAPVPPASDASDLVFLGELRMLKGVDVLIEAVGLLRRQGQPVTATLVGDGPDAAALRAQVARLTLGDTIRFRSTMPARAAMALGRVMVVPSRAESLPYVVLEAAAAEKPLVATNVGGIPEIYGPLADALVPPGDAAALARTIAQRLDDPAASGTLAQQLRTRVASSFSLDAMVDGVLAGYEAAREQAKTTQR